MTTCADSGIAFAPPSNGIFSSSFFNSDVYHLSSFNDVRKSSISSLNARTSPSLQGIGKLNYHNIMVSLQSTYQYLSRPVAFEPEAESSQLMFSSTSKYGENMTHIMKKQCF